MSTDKGAVRRYIIDPHERDQYSVEYSEGDPRWVHVQASDYDALLAECDTLKASNERLVARVAELEAICKGIVLKITELVVKSGDKKAIRALHDAAIGAA